MKKLFTSESVLDFYFVSDPRISPGGTYTAFLVKQANAETNGYDTVLYILENETGALKKMKSAGTVSACRWMNDETILKAGDQMNYLAFNVVTEKTEELFTLPVKAGGVLYAGAGNYAVTSPFDNGSPDTSGLTEEERISALNEYKAKNYEVIEEIPFTQNGGGFVSGKRNRLYLYDTYSDKLTAVTGPFFNVVDVKAADDKILYTGQEFQDVKSLKNGVYLYDMHTGETRCLLDQDKFLIKGFEVCGHKVILNLTDGEGYGNGENGSFYTIDIETGELLLLCRHSHACIGNAITTDVKVGAGQTMKVDGNYLYYTSTVDMDCVIERIDIETGICEKITGTGAVDFLDVREGRIICAAFLNNHPEELYEWKNGEFYALTHLNDSILDEYEVSKPEYIESEGSAPWPIHGYVLKPAGYQPGQKYPGILSMHGGPRLTYGPVFNHQMQLFASSGYFVFFCNPRGSEGRGNEFGDIRSRFGEIDFQDFMEFTDKVLETYPDLDSSRIGVEGGSYGGFMTNWIIGHTDRFKAACSQRSIANWTGMEGTTDIGYYFCKGQTGASHMEDHELQWRQSPLAYADKCVTPTLFIHGDKDYRCFQQEAFQMYTALKIHGCEAKLCVFEGENHELSRSGRPRQRIQRLEEMQNWFNLRLGGTKETRPEESKKLHRAVKGKDYWIFTELNFLHEGSGFGENRSGHSEAFGINDKKDTDLSGMVICPPEIDPDRKYPAVLYIDTGSGDAHIWQAIAARGIFVIRCMAGRDIYGNYYLELVKNGGEEAQAKLLEFMKACIRHYPCIDSERIGITGAGWGGYMTDWLISHTNCFKAAVCQRGINNLITAGLIREQDSDPQPSAMDITPWNREDLLWDHSPLKYVKHINIPVLFLQGDQDYKCYMGEAFQMFTALKQLEVQTKMILFHGGSHSIPWGNSSAGYRKYVSSLTEWFEKYL